MYAHILYTETILYIILVWDKCRHNQYMSHFPLFISQVHVNPAQSQLTLEGDDALSFSRALQHVEYLNSLQFPTPGVRPLKLQTTVRWVIPGHVSGQDDWINHEEKRPINCLCDNWWSTYGCFHCS